jgi:hypothetical protein
MQRAVQAYFWITMYLHLDDMQLSAKADSDRSQKKSHPQLANKYYVMSLFPGM